MAFPINTVMFSGFGDSGTYRFRDPGAAWADLGQPPISPSSGTGGCTGLATYSSGKVVHTGGTFGAALTRSFNEDFSTAGTIPGADGATGELNIACDGSGNCYHLIDVSGWKIAKAAPADTAWTVICPIAYAATADPPGVLAVNQAGTVAYFSSSYHRTPGGNPLTVYRVDLATGTITTFATNVITVGTILEAILVLSDDSVVIAWGAGSAAAFPKRYSSAGALLTTYGSLPDNYYSATGIALAYLNTGAVDAASFFMAWYSDAPGSGVTVARINASTGAVVGTSLQAPSDGFEWDGPITALRTPSAPPPPPGPPPPPEPPPSPGPADCCAAGTGDGGGGGTGGGGTGESAFNPQGWGDAETGGYFPHPLCAHTEGTAIATAPVDPPEDLAGVTQSHVWAKITTVIPPSVGLGPTVAKTFNYALGQPIPDPAAYMGGYKPRKIKSIGTITRTVSNWDGDYVGSAVDFDIDDSDRDFRNALTPAQMKYLTGAEVNTYVVSETRRRARGVQVPIQRAIVHAYNFQSGYLGAKLTAEDVISAEYGPLGQGRKISDRKLTRGLFPYLPVANINLPQQFVLAIVSDRGAWAGDMAHPAEKGMVNLTTVGGRHINGHYCTELFVCAHAVAGIDLWASNPEQTQRILIPDSDYGTAAFAPGKPGWPFPTPYFDAVDAHTGLTHRYTSVFLAGKYADAHNSGAIAARAGICGVEAVGDGSGAVIVDAFQAWQWACDNLIFRKGGYYTGNYQSAPLFGDGTPYTDSARFAAMQALSARWIGGRGYKSGFVIDGSMLSKDVMKYFALQTGARYGWTRAGQFAPFLFDDAQPLTNLRRLRGPFTVRGATAPRYSNDVIANPVSYDFDYDPDTDNYRGISIPQRDQNAIDATGGIEREITIDMRATRYPATALDVAARELFWRRLPLPIVDIPLTIGGNDLELYELVLLSGADGEGEGWVDVPVRIDAITFDSKTRRTVATGLVVGTNHANTEGGVVGGGGDGIILSSHLTWADVASIPLGDLAHHHLVA